MNLAVLLAKDTENSRQLPGDWPYECRELGTGTALPSDGRNWILMSCSDLSAYQLAHSDEINAWIAANPIPTDS